MHIQANSWNRSFSANALTYSESYENRIISLNRKYNQLRTRRKYALNEITDNTYIDLWGKNGRRARNWKFYFPSSTEQFIK